MRDSSAWSWNCGVWKGVRVYLHASLLVFVVLIFFLAGRPRLTEFTPNGFIAVGAVLVVILLHELGHLLTTWRLGGKIDVMVLGPLGSWQSSNLSREPHREIIAAMSGPLANLLGMLASGPALIAGGQSLGDILLHPLYPSGILSGTAWLVAVKLFFWFNWLYFLVNLIPASPLDGGRAVRSVLWPVMGYRAAIRTVSRTGMVISLTLCLVALISFKTPDPQLVPPWLPLILMAIYLYFNSRQELQRTEEDDTDEDLLGYDFSQGYTSLERSASLRRRGVPNPLRRWMQQRQEVKQRRLRELEADEEQRVDEVLVRVKELGIHALSPDERALLNRVSVRYRNRLQS